MFIKLTNAAVAHKGKEVAINSSNIVSISEEKLERQLDESTTVLENVTLIFCPPHGTWEVQESLNVIISKLNGKQGWLK